MADPELPRCFAFERALAKIPPPVRLSFTAEQLSCLASALQPEPSRHKLDWRVSLPFFGRRFYLTIFAGEERRSLARLLEEGQLDLSRISIVYSLAALLALSCLLSAVVASLYILKCLLGIDVMPGPSPLHELLYTGVQP